MRTQAILCGQTINNKYVYGQKPQYVGKVFNTDYSYPILNFGNTKKTSNRDIKASDDYVAEKSLHARSVDVNGCALFQGDTLIDETIMTQREPKQCYMVAEGNFQAKNANVGGAVFDKKAKILETIETSTDLSAHDEFYAKKANIGENVILKGKAKIDELKAGKDLFAYDLEARRASAQGSRIYFDKTPKLGQLILLGNNTKIQPYNGAKFLNFNSLVPEMKILLGNIPEIVINFYNEDIEAVMDKLHFYHFDEKAKGNIGKKVSQDFIDKVIKVARLERSLAI